MSDEVISTECTTETTIGSVSGHSHIGITTAGQENCRVQAFFLKTQRG